MIRRRLRRSEFLDRERAEQAQRTSLAAAQHHVGKASQVAGCGEHPGVSGHAAHVAGGGVVNHASKGRFLTSQELRGGDARAQRKRRLEHRVGHPEGLEDDLGGILRQGLPRQPADDLPEQDEVDVAVSETLPGPGHWFVDERQLDSGFVPAPGRLQVQIGPQAGKVRQQLAYGDLARAALEFRQVLGYPVVEPELTFLE